MFLQIAADSFTGLQADARALDLLRLLQNMIFNDNFDNCPVERGFHANVFSFVAVFHNVREYIVEESPAGRIYLSSH